MYKVSLFSLALVFLFATGCHPTPGPDKSLVGGVLGAGWGAGAGAVIGHQTGAAGPGAAIGSGIGFASGLVQGIGLDISEGTELEQERELDALRVRVATNERALIGIQRELDNRDRKLKLTGASSGNAIFFDSGRASLRSGSVAHLQRLADSIKLNPYVGSVRIFGHADDAGSKEMNQRLSEARALTVSTFLASYGVPADRIQTVGLGASRPVTSNRTGAGRQLNRRAEIVLEK